MLASRGHECRVVAPAVSGDTPQQAARVRAELDEQGLRPIPVHTDARTGVELWRHGALTVCSVRDPGRARAVLRQQIAAFEPTWVLVSSEDLGQGLLQEAHRSAAGRVIYLAHTPQMFPFGPYSLNPNAAGAELVARSAGIVAIGNTMADYIEQHLGVRPAVIHPPVYGPGPHPRRPPEEDGLILMVNPCAVKGITIFLALARRFPEYRFGALRGWGTTTEDLQALARLANVSLLPKVKEITAVLSRTKILLMPSLWPEGFGLIVMEAMLHGVPVLASDQGGLAEAKAGTRYVLPVRPIERYRTVFDENRLPMPVVPEQDIEPWARAVRELMSDPELYRREAEAARTAAERFVAGVRATALEEYLAALKPGAGRAAPAPAFEAVRRLSAERRALLAARLRNMKPPESA